MKGHLKVIILSTLSDGPCHAYALKKRIQEKSLKVFSLAEGTVYPTLHKLEESGLIESKWLKRDKGPNVRDYSITQKGEKHLKEKTEEWHYFSQAMNLILKTSPVDLKG